MAASRSASAKTMLGDLPPSSRLTRLRFDCAAAVMTSFPVAPSPGKATLSPAVWPLSAAASGARIAESLTVVGRFQISKFVDVLINCVGELVQQPAAFARGHLRPRAGRQRFACSFDRPIDVGLVTFGDLADDLTGRRVNC